MDKAVETLPMEAGALFQFDDRERAFHVAVSHNLSPDHVDRITFAFEAGVPGWVVNHRQTLVISDASDDPRVHPYVVEEGVQSVLATPMIAHDKVVGVLNLYAKKSVNIFDDSAVRLAEIYAAQAAVAIENARLVSELRHAAAELEARVERRTRQLRETQEQIIRAEKLAVVGRLAASVAHEVNNPLQSMALQLQLLTDERLADGLQERLVILQKEVARISAIVRRLLDFQRRKPGERSSQSVAELLQDVLVLAGKQLQNSRVEVINKACAQELTIEVVPDQMKQVFLNLVLNAVDAMPHGGKLNIATCWSDGLVTIAFTDTGDGMSPETLEKLFEPFFSTKQEGSGLGLAISHEIVSEHGGSLEAISAPGEGSTFIVGLPAYIPEASQS